MSQRAESVSSQGVGDKKGADIKYYKPDIWNALSFCRHPILAAMIFKLDIFTAKNRNIHNSENFLLQLRTQIVIISSN